MVAIKLIIIQQIKFRVNEENPKFKLASLICVLKQCFTQPFGDCLALDFQKKSRKSRYIYIV